MLMNYLKTAFRNLWKRRAFSLINIVGLAFGMTASFLIFLYVRFEVSYDSFHSRADRIYRVVCDVKTPSETVHANGPAWPVGPALKREFPDIERAVRTATVSFLFRKGDIKFQEENSLLADPDFFRVFDFPLLKGDPNTCLKEPFSVVFSAAAAKKYFGDSNPIGQTLLLAQKGWPVRVTGVMKDLPGNSMVSGDVVVSMSTETMHLNQGLEDTWLWWTYHPVCYLLLRPHARPYALQTGFAPFMAKMENEEMRKQHMASTLSLEPVTAIYLHSTRDGSKGGNARNVYLFSCIAAIILLIACINFVNLTTARSVERAREVGVRKVMGALQPQLALQFAGESVLLCLFAFSISLVAAALLLPQFNQLAGKPISQGVFEHPADICYLFAATFLIGLLAGFYPAIILSSFRPSSVLKGRFSTGSRGSLLRKGLVLVQFTLSIGFIIASIIVYQQLKYMREQDLGFSKEQMMIIDSEGDPHRMAFQDALRGVPGVISSSLCSNVPGTEVPIVNCEIENYKGDMQVANLDSYFVDWDYIRQFRIRMLAGRDFSRNFQTDTTQAMLLNAAASKMFGYASPQQAVGKRFSQFGREGKIIGVMQDFHYRSLQEQIQPLTVRIEPQACYLVAVKVAAGGLPSTMKAIEQKWKSVIPYRPFIYYFLDEYFDKQYRADERFGKLFLYFTVLAICISCMGLLGLSAYSIVQRTKEVAVRKVMGASVSAIVHLLSRDFLLLVVLAFLVASPLTWWLMHGWLTDFAYRIRISWIDFLVAGLLAVMIALLTISVNAVRAAMANPVNSLRAE
ncbi:MAG TPA: ABC transporter permease [Puia sp.]|nr:ABC transporter permease [Puia sp.]